MLFSEEFVRIRNMIYHSISKCFRIGRDDIDRFIRAVSGVFGRLRCNKVDIQLEECVVYISDLNGNNKAIQRKIKPTELKKPDCYIVTDPIGHLDDTDQLDTMHEDEPLTNVTFIQVQPYKEKLTRRTRSDSSTSDDQPTKPRLWGKAKRALARTFWRKPSVPSTDLVIEDLEYDEFWATMKDANLVMTN